MNGNENGVITGTVLGDLPLTTDNIIGRQATWDGATWIVEDAHHADSNLPHRGGLTDEDGNVVRAKLSNTFEVLMNMSDGAVEVTANACAYCGLLAERAGRIVSHQGECSKKPAPEKPESESTTRSRRNAETLATIMAMPLSEVIERLKMVENLTAINADLHDELREARSELRRVRRGLDNFRNFLGSQDK